MDTQLVQKTRTLRQNTRFSSLAVSKRVSQILRKSWVEAVEATTMSFVTASSSQNPKRPPQPNQVHEAQNHNNTTASEKSPTRLHRHPGSRISLALSHLQKYRERTPAPSENTWFTRPHLRLPKPNTDTLLPWYHTSYPTGIHFPFLAPASPATTVPILSLRRGDKLVLNSTLHFFLRASARHASQLLIVDMIDMTSLRESRVYVEPNYRFLCPDVEYQSHTVTDFSVLEVRGKLMLKLGEQTVYVEMSENLAGSEMVEILRQGKEVEAWTACTGGVGYVVGWQMGCALRRAVGVGMGCATWRYFCSGGSDAGLAGEREVKAHRQGYQWKDECRYCKRRTESATGRVRL